ncbi:MAG: aspartyl protease [Phycisphaerae bacterium]|jgi:clan AA aspartic protease
MGLTFVRIEVRKSREFERAEFVEFLVDSGAVDSLVPGALLEKRGCKSYWQQEFVVSDGTKVARRVGDAYFEYQGVGGPAPVIFGERGDEPLLGVTTLESLGLVFNPFNRTLSPMRMLLAAAAGRPNRRRGIEHSGASQA